jgi:preprotein translocase subunit SecE
MSKVHTPTRGEVQATTIVVIVTVFLFAAYFEAVDLVLGRGIDQMFLHLTKH